MNMRIIQATRRSFAFRLSECGSSEVLEEGKKLGLILVGNYCGKTGGEATWE